MVRSPRSQENGGYAPDSFTDSTAFSRFLLYVAFARRAPLDPQNSRHQLRNGIVQ